VAPSFERLKAQGLECIAVFEAPIKAMIQVKPIAAMHTPATSAHRR
jgi:hypothetical protein